MRIAVLLLLIILIAGCAGSSNSNKNNTDILTSNTTKVCPSQPAPLPCSGTLTKKIDAQGCVVGYECTATSTNATSTIAIIADESTYQALGPEINRLALDIEKDTENHVDLMTFNPDADKTQIKSYLSNLYLNQNLRAAILVGNIQTAYYSSSAGASDFPSDTYYYDVYGKCALMQGYSALDNTDKFCNPIAIPFVITRIKAPVQGSVGIAMIKNYLDKNHEFRTGKITFQEKSLVYTPLVNDIGDAQARQDSMNSLINNLKAALAINEMPIYDDKEIVISEWQSTPDDTAPKDQYLTELVKSHEFNYVNAHGYPQGHIFNITKSDIQNPNAFYAVFESCSVGKFDEPYYLAGYYLFNGNTMFVQAPSDTLFSPVGYVDGTAVLMLKQGQTILDIIKAKDPSLIIQYFGDPTLRLPAGLKQKSSQARISLDKSELDFGSIKICKNIENYRNCDDSSGQSKITITVSNTGQESLGFLTKIIPDYSFDLLSNSHVRDGYDKPYQMSFDNINYRADPKGTSSFSITLVGVAAGSYSGQIWLISNDPLRPVIKIPYKIKITD
ncbi:MAG: hypothetical protein HYU56_01975 [Candidatus Aenigmarchaeota archaeon]|nr:hypothetical protein [Candidatus Aenigmarchaeota archaeon]